MKRLFIVFAFISLLTGCVQSPSNIGQFSSTPVKNHDLVIYTCTGTQEKFIDYRPVLDNLQKMPRSVTVLDVGASWVATWDGGKLESPKMFKDVIGKIDGNVNTATGERYYRINKTVNDGPTYSFSDVNPHTGEGKGMTFFRCSGGLIDEVPTPITIVPLEENK